MIVEGSESKMLIFPGFSMIFGGSESKMLIFRWFFNDFDGVGVGNVDFPLVFQWFLGCSLSRRISKRSARAPAVRPRGGFRDPFYHLKNPLAKRY